MKYSVRWGEREAEVEVAERDGALFVRLDGEEWIPVDLSCVEPAEKYSVLLGPRSFFVTIDGDAQAMRLGVAGRVFDVEVEDERERALRAVAGGRAGRGGVVASVMPGIVRRVDVREGDVVEEGARLVVLEAMKMENEILAEEGGRVVAVHVEEGATVETGDPLVTLGPLEEGG